jgi:hypothetical protein
MNLTEHGDNNPNISAFVALTLFEQFSAPDFDIHYYSPITNHYSQDYLIVN